MLNEKLEKLRLPKLLEFLDGSSVTSEKGWEKRRKEILDLLSEEEYGLRPLEPLALSVTEDEVNEDAYAGKVLEQHFTLHAQMEDGTMSFPFHLFVPKSIEKPMTIVYIAFRPNLPDLYLPIEEITDEGFAIATFCYQDIAADRDDDFTGGLAGLLKKEGKRSGNDTGKIMMWSWAASRVMDYLLTRDNIDHKNIAVMGHSRLGKAALVTAAYDERFTFAFPNNSGCSGDAISRGKEGERISHITESFPYWFCPDYKKYANKEEHLPFDQHFLIAAIAPRFVCGGAAVEDVWADPNHQYLSYVAADEAYRLLGKEGFIHPNRLAKMGESFHEGSLGFHLRSGTHFHSRYDWLRYMEFMKKHKI